MRATRRLTPSPPLPLPPPPLVDGTVVEYGFSWPSESSSLAAMVLSAATRGLSVPAQPAVHPPAPGSAAAEGRRAGASTADREAAQIAEADKATRQVDLGVPTDSGLLTTHTIWLRSSLLPPCLLAIFLRCAHRCPPQHVCLCGCCTVAAADPGHDCLRDLQPRPDHRVPGRLDTVSIAACKPVLTARSMCLM